MDPDNKSRKESNAEAITESDPEVMAA